MRKKSRTDMEVADKDGYKRTADGLLESVVEYAPKAIGELKKLSVEFYGLKQDDSDEYLDFVLENNNWLIQALNATMPLLNEERQRIDKERADRAVLELNEALSSQVDARIADALDKGLIPVLEEFLRAAEEVL